MPAPAPDPSPFQGKNLSTVPSCSAPPCRSKCFPDRQPGIASCRHHAGCKAPCGSCSGANAPGNFDMAAPRPTRATPVSGQASSRGPKSGRCMGLAWSVKGDGGAILARLVKNLRSANLNVELGAWHACRPCLALHEPFGVDEVAFVALYHFSLAHRMLPAWARCTGLNFTRPLPAWANY